MRRLRRSTNGGTLKNRAEIVVIGGGVGGCSILYWLTELGKTDVLLVERAELTSGSTFHSAGLVGQLRSSLPLTKMMMWSVELYRTLGEKVGLETGWREVGSVRLASSQERMEELARQAGWAKTFGLPLELVSASEAQELFPPMRTDGVLGAAYLATDGYIDPSQLTYALAEGARRGGAEIAQQTRVTGIHVERRTRDGGRNRQGRDRDRGGRQRRRHVRPGDRGAGRCNGSDRPDGPRVPRHEAGRATARHADDARSFAARLLPPGVRRADHGRLRASLRPMGPRRDPGRLQRQAAGRGLAALRGADGERGRARSLARGDGGRPARERPRGVHAGQRVHPRPDRRSRALDGGRLLRPRARRRRWHGRLVAEWIVDGCPRSTLGRWTPAASAGRTARSTTPSRGRRRCTRPTTTSGTRGTSGRPAGLSASRLPTPPSATWARPSARSRAGSARTGSSRTRPRAIPSYGREAGPGGCGRLRSARSTLPAGRRRRCSTSRPSRRSRCPGKARRVPRADVRQPRRA